MRGREPGLSSTLPPNLPSFFLSRLFNLLFPFLSFSLSFVNFFLSSFSFLLISLSDFLINLTSSLSSLPFPSFEILAGSNEILVKVSIPGWEEWIRERKIEVCIYDHRILVNKRDRKEGCSKQDLDKAISRSSAKSVLIWWSCDDPSINELW